MRNWLTIAALLVFVVSTGLLGNHHRPTTELPPAMAEFGQGDTVTSGIGS